MNTVDQTDEMWKQIHKVVYATAKKVNGSVEWIAKQEPEPDVYGFVLDYSGRETDDGFASFTLAEAAHMDDALIERLATEVLGYAPFSPQDIQRRQEHIKMMIRGEQHQIDRHKSELSYWKVELLKLNELLESK